MNVIQTCTAVATAIGVIGGGAITLDHMHVSAAEFNRHMAESRVRQIFSYVEAAQRNGPAGWLCRAIEEEFIALCTEAPDHYLCKDLEAKDDIMGKAGCQ